MARKHRVRRLASRRLHRKDVLKSRRTVKIESGFHQALDLTGKVGDEREKAAGSSDSAMLLLDWHLNIRSFTPLAARLFNISSTSVGGSLGDLTNPFTDIDLLADARAVLTGLKPVSREAQSGSGDRYLCSVSPAEFRGDAIEGVAINVADISGLMQANQALADKLEAITHVRDITRDALRSGNLAALLHRILEATIALHGADFGNIQLYDSRGGCLRIAAQHGFAQRFLDFFAEVDSHGGSVCGATLACGQRIVVTDIDESPEFSTILEEARAAGFRAVQSTPLLSASGDFLGVLSTHFREPHTFSDHVLRLTDIYAREASDAVEMMVRIEAAEQASLAKAQFLATASHDLRQPLQTLELLQTGLRQQVKDRRAQPMIARMRRVVENMAGMLTGLFNVDRLETGGMKTTWSDFQVNELFDAMSSEFAEQAQHKGLGWRLVPCKLVVHSDRHLLEDMVRNLLSNAIRCTERGKILLGCRRPGDAVRIEIWDTGVGIPEEQLTHTFEAYRQTSDTDRWGGLGLGLPIVRRFGELLGHPLRVRSWLGKGSVFSIEVPLAGELRVTTVPSDQPWHTGATHAGSAPMLDDELSTQEAVGAMRGADERQVAATTPGEAATGHIAGRPAPATATLPSEGPAKAADAAPGTIFVIDDDRDTRDAMRMLLTDAGYQVKTYASARSFLHDPRPQQVKACLVVDVRMPGMNGLEMLAQLASAGSKLPAIIITGHGDIAMAVQAVRAGAVDFIEKPIGSEVLLTAVDRALQQAERSEEWPGARSAAAMRVAALTRREREVMELVVAGRANKEIAARLGISQRTVETHRATVMKKLRVRSVSDLVRLDLSVRELTTRSGT